MILGATLLADRKRYSSERIVSFLIESLEIDSIYINIETKDPSSWNWIEKLLSKSNKSYSVDYWSIQGTGFVSPQYDQDPNRVPRICVARNMAVEYAIYRDVSHLLFIDSDVYPHDGSVQKVIDLHKPIAGGLVPGRGAHSHVNYIFGQSEKHGNIVKCAHGTCGFMLIERHVFEILRFRTGPHPNERGVWLSEDPAYVADAYLMGLADGWWIDLTAKADHLDDPGHPLTLEEAMNGHSAYEG